MQTPPRRPPGMPPSARPPAARVPSGPPPSNSPNTPQGIIGVKRPPGPPPIAPPVSSIKPPPRAPPPESVQSQANRPPIESKRPQPVFKRMPPRNPPPDAAKINNFVNSPIHKAGAISMFEDKDVKSTPAPAEPKSAPTQPAPAPAAKGQLWATPVAPGGPRGGPRGPAPRGPPPRGAPPPRPNFPTPLGRAAKPLPPTPNPPGIPAGKPFPPEEKPDWKTSKAPAPTRPPPRAAGGGRAPPKEDPEDEAQSKSPSRPAPPDSAPPLLRVKKPVQAEVLKRREREMPEFESSDDDEEGPKFVQQPLPFGVLKQEIPATSMEAKAEEDALREAARAAPPPDPTASLDAFDPVEEIKKEEEETIGFGTSEVPPPSMAPPEAFTSVAASTIGETLDKHFDDSALGKTLTRGRLSIRCLEGLDIRRKDDRDRIPRNDPFLKFRLGAAERLPWKSTDVRRKQDGNPDFGNELITFDVTDPAQFVLNEDVQLCIELWNKSLMRNELIGSVSMSVVRFFKQPYVSFTEKVPIYYPGANRTTMKLVLEMVFEEARSGLAQITLFEANNLRNLDPMGKQDPYVQLSLGRHYKKRSKCVKGGGANPYFEEEDILLWIDQQNWVEDLQLDVLDEDTKEEKPIGSTHFSLLPYMKVAADDAQEDTYDLFYFMLIDPKDDTEKKEVACGEITIRVRFLPAGKLTVTLDRAKSLQFPENFKPVGGSVRLDPYVQLTMDGKAVKTVKRTPADKDGGSEPVWESDVVFEVVDQYLMELEVLNQSLVGEDIQLGSVQVSLLNVYRNGHAEFWTSLRQKKANGGIKEAGDIFVQLAFTGPTGIAFPQLRPELDSFDDTLRKSPTKEGAVEEEEEVRQVISTVPPEESESEKKRQRQEIMARQQAGDADDLPPEFTEEEIIAAFKFIDLDRNNFVGAAEIRHILVCMGEMITDEEIDTMISMVDMDGDGQVSFKEFRTLVLHPNPGLVDMHKEINKIRDQEIMKEKQALAGKSQGVDLSAFQRQKEMTTREQKKRMISSFVLDNEVDFDYIKRSHIHFLELPKEKRPGGRIKFPEFCQVMDVEPITEYKNLHAFYDTEEMGDMDIREFLLSMMNFIPVEKELRIRFSFTMFDELKSGYISQRDVEEILRGNHMMSIASVQRKAETIMKQANSTKTGAITMNEFVVVSKKFPNILLPAVLQNPPASLIPASAVG